jgi:hypothetical protein
MGLDQNIPPVAVLRKHSTYQTGAYRRFLPGLFPALAAQVRPMQNQ